MEDNSQNTYRKREISFNLPRIRKAFDIVLAPLKQKGWLTLQTVYWNITRIIW